MWAYIVRRLLIGVPLLVAMAFVTFLFIHLAPGDVLAQYRENPSIPQELIQQYEARFHLKDPVVVQFGYWLWNLAHGDLGESFVRKAPVAQVIRERLWNTVLLSLTSLLFTWLVALPLGIFAAVHQYSWGDKVFSVLAFLGMSLPTFFSALLLLYLVSLLGWLPLGGMVSANFESLSFAAKVLDVATHLIIPTLVIGASAVAGLQRLTRGNMLEVLRQQYIVTARAKGLPEHRVIYHHALRNAINPLITIFGYEFSALLSGAALTENIVSWPGLGALMLEAVLAQDIYLVMGDMLMAGVLLIVGNLIADILLAYADPTISAS
jgi:peptide/nickel transport system permease protein